MYSAVLNYRLAGAASIAKTLNMAQKCAIPGVSGADENVFCVIGLLYDFHEGARRGVYQIGAQRIIFLNDISKAFDREQVSSLLDAIFCQIGGGEPTPEIKRFLATINSTYENAEIIGTGDGVSVVGEKTAGAIQGDPPSGTGFCITMEYARSRIPPGARCKVTLKCSRSKWTARIEMDYADDQVRCADSVADMQRVIQGIATALRLIHQQWNVKKLLIVALRVTSQRAVETFHPEIYATEKKFLLLEDLVFDQC